MKNFLKICCLIMLVSFLFYNCAEANPLFKKQVYKTANKGEKIMTLEEVRKKDSVIDYFVQLAQIPSPSLKEEKVANKIMEILEAKGVPVSKDNYGNLIAVLDANKSTAPSIMLSAHMDVVGSDDAVNIRVSADNKYLETDKKRTLGADDKAGDATIIDTLIYFKEHPEIAHPKIEAVFTRDEEFGMSGIKNLDTTKITAQNALMLDGDNLGECNIAGAGFTNLTISVTDGKSGHSGVDIGDKDRISANKVLAEIVADIPQGVYKKDKTGVVTSINSGVIVGGSAGLYLKSNKNGFENQSQKEVLKNIADNSFRNIISANAYATYSIRSSEPENEAKLRKEIEKIIVKTAKKYDGKIKINAEFETHVKPFVRDDNEKFVNIVVAAAQKQGLNSTPTSFHAAAETHIIQNDKLNAKGEKFKPLLLGIANLYNMHSPDEKLDFESLIVGRNWVVEIIKNCAN